MNRIVSVAAAPFRIGAQALVAVAGGASMLFARARGFGILLSRTLIDYRSEIGDPLSNSIVAAVVGWVARNFPEAPVRVVREGMTGDEARIPPGPTGVGRFLRLLERPNPHYSGPLQWMATISDWMIGNAYWFKERDDFNRVIAYWWMPAWMIEPKWPESDATVFISHYEYSVDGVQYKVGVEDVVHFRNGIDPRNPRKGLSRLGSLFREIFTDNEAAAFTASLLRNLGVPGVIISPANTTGGGPMRMDGDAVKKDFKERFSGDNRGEPMVMKGATDVKVLSWSPEQLNLKALRRIPEERVSAVTGVPAGVAGLGAGLDRNTFTNYGEANKAAITQGLFPAYRLIGADLESQALPDFDVEEVIAGLDVWFDWTVMAAMQEAAEAIWKRAESAATKGLLKRSDFLLLIGRKPAEDGSDDVFVHPNNYIETPAGAAAPASLAARRQPVDPLSDTEPVALNAGVLNGNGHHLEPTGAPA